MWMYAVWVYDVLDRISLKITMIWIYDSVQVGYTMHFETKDINSAHMLSEIYNKAA